MKKIITFTALVLGLAIAEMAYAAPDKKQNEAENNIDDIFNFNIDDFDPTTAFLNIEVDEESLDETDGSNVAVDVDVDDLIAYAKQYLGRPYVYGAKGPSAFDCSGFTSYVFRKFNVSLSPASRMQIHQGVKVAREDVRPGDLLFFSGRSSSGVGHVALAIDVNATTGDITFIHAAGKSVRIDTLQTVAYYNKRYLGARRVIK